MAGFLRKKNKDAPVKPVPSSPIPLGTAVSPPPAVPPLYARFSTSTKSDNGVTANPRIVSSPKVLSRKDPPQRVANRGNGQATPTGGPKKRSSASPSGSLLFQYSLHDSLAQNQVPSKSQAPVQSVHVQPPLTPPAPILNKPLPPPSPPVSNADPSGSTPTQSFMSGNKQTRPPPSAFQNQPLSAHVDSSSSYFPSFSSAQTSNTLISNPASRRPSTSSSLTSPSKRNPSPLSNANLPPQMLPPIVNRKMNQQNPPAPTFGRQNLLPTTTQTQTLHLSQRSSVENQDLQPANDMPMIGASSTQMDLQQQQLSDIQASDRSDIDLPPEFAALFHVSYSFYFSLVLDEESCPNLS